MKAIQLKEIFKIIEKDTSTSCENAAIEAIKKTRKKWLINNYYASNIKFLDFKAYLVTPCKEKVWFNTIYINTKPNKITEDYFLPLHNVPWVCHFNTYSKPKRADWIVKYKRRFKVLSNAQYKTFKATPVKLHISKEAYNILNGVRDFDHVYSHIEDSPHLIFNIKRKDR